MRHWQVPRKSGVFMEDLKLGELTSRQVESLLASQDLDLIIPLGACEQHGPHLPLSTDQIIAEKLAERVANIVGDSLIAPSIPVGVSGHHLSFSGTSTISSENYVSHLVDIVSAYLRHGFRTVYLITGHAGNCTSMSLIKERFAEELVVSFDDWPTQRSLIHDVAVAKLGLDPEVVGTHAGHFETSIILLIRPDLVHEEEYEPGFVGPADQASSKLMSEGMQGLSNIGVIGDPHGATAEAGELYMEALASHVVSGINAHREMLSQKVSS